MRIAVAKFESTPVTPVFARTAGGAREESGGFCGDAEERIATPLQGES